jgi:hypothetical protein
MKEEKKSTTRKKKTPTTERSKKDPRRLANGDFDFGNEIGKDTRFKEGNTVHPAPIGNDYSLKYDDSFIDLLYEYYDGGYAEIDDSVFPTQSGFPRWLRKKKGIYISQRSMALWTSGEAEYARRFAEVFKELHNESANMLHNGALSRRFDAGYSKLLASACFGMREKTEIKQELSGEAAFNVSISYFDGEDK